ncbi:MAG: hypothetical protein ACO3ZW_10075, partial [Opitutales bacterium]
PKAAILKAIESYRAALRVQKPLTRPVDCLQTGRNMGNLGFKEGDWALAVEGYSIAVEAVEQSRAWATDEARRQEVVRQSIGVYENLIQSAVNLGNTALALQVVERSRSKRLADLTVIDDLYPDGKVPADVRQWHQQYQASRQAQAKIRLEHPEIPEEKGDRQVYATRSTRASLATQELLAAEAAEQEAYNALYRLDAITAQLQKPQPLPELTDLLALLPNAHTALLSFYTTSSHAYIFILRANSEVICHTCPNPPESTTDLQSWLVDTWVNPYIGINQGDTKEERQQRRDTWHQSMPATLQELAQRLDLDTLINKHLQDITDLILIPHLFLHQIPFDLLPYSPPVEGSGVVQSPPVEGSGVVQSPPVEGSGVVQSPPVEGS